MNKLMAAAAAFAVTMGGAVASADEVARVDDPVGQFSGSYDCSYYTYDAEGTATKTTRSCSQAGYVAVYDDGIVACNGNEAITRPDDGSPLQGFVWIGPEHAADGEVTGAAPGNVFGAGNNQSADDPNTADADEAHGPCEDAPPPKS